MKTEKDAIIVKIKHLGSINEVLEIFEKDVIASEMRNLFPLDRFDYLWTSDESLIPSISAPFASPFLYRGQTNRYEPCYPSVFRGMTHGFGENNEPGEWPVSDRIRLVVDRIKLEEFVLAFSDHPATKYAREIGLRLHPVALAQHYGLATDRIDLTQDHMVAAFFATNSQVGDVWKPAKTGVGVMYRLLAEPFRKHLPEHLTCIGKQVLPRPGGAEGFYIDASNCM